MRSDLKLPNLRGEWISPLLFIPLLLHPLPKKSPAVDKAGVKSTSHENPIHFF